MNPSLMDLASEFASIFQDDPERYGFYGDIEEGLPSDYPAPSRQGV